jgi:hypothetical protein
MCLNNFYSYLCGYVSFCIQRQLRIQKKRHLLITKPLILNEKKHLSCNEYQHSRRVVSAYKQTITARPPKTENTQ